MNWTTCDLSDEFRDAARVLPPVFRSYGGRPRFSGTIVTIKCFEDNALLKETVQTEGRGKVLVVDGGGSLRCALAGDVIAKLASEAGWEGAVIYGCVRDSVGMSAYEFGVRALGTIPRRPSKRGEGQVGIPVSIAGIPCSPGERLFADEDGIVVLDRSVIVHLDKD
jgi:regulator of ribonuclease activity A